MRKNNWQNKEFKILKTKLRKKKEKTIKKIKEKKKILRKKSQNLSKMLGHFFNTTSVKK